MKLLRGVYDRTTDLVVKVLSVKGLVFGLATWLVYHDKLESWMWLVTAAIVIGGRTLEKILQAGGHAGTPVK